MCFSSEVCVRHHSRRLGMPRPSGFRFVCAFDETRGGPLHFASWHRGNTSDEHENRSDYAKLAKMIPLSLRDIRQAVGGKAITLISDDAPLVLAVCTDSKSIEKSSVFVAIRGEKFDGHQFLSEAANRGAIAAIVDSPPTSAPAGMAIIQVPQTRIALGKLARHVRQSLRGKVIAVAGSNGKTSTKNLIHAALRGRLKGSISPKSFNNDIGVPIAIFAAEASHDYLVLEMGTNHHGEIQPLSDMAQPDLAVITNCGAEHLEGLTDLAGVRRENARIISGLNPKGTLVVNGDEAELLSALKDWRGKRLTFGFNPSNDLFATDIDCTPTGTTFRLNGRAQRVFVPMLGRHSASNALAAIGVGRAMRLAEDAIIESLASSDNPEMRMQRQTAGGITILNDCYNANPSSMRAGIETLSEMNTTGRRVAVLGDMRELGESSEAYHREAGELVAGVGNIDALICVGQQAYWIASAAEQAGFSGDAITKFDHAADAAEVVPQLMQSDDLVLIKASRGIKLEQVANAILKSRAPNTGSTGLEGNTLSPQMKTDEHR